jgi:two-component system chemotaxis response regulator CheY
MYWLTRSELPAAIVIDPELPDTQNWELVEYFKTSELYKNIPMVVISSLDEEEIATVCSQYNVEAAFHKPFNPVDLTKTLEALTQSPAISLKKQLKAV